MAGFHGLDFMAAGTADVNKHDIAACYKPLCDLLLKGEEIQPLRSAITVGGHPRTKLVEILRVFGQPFKSDVGRGESILEGVVLGVSGVLVISSC